MGIFNRENLITWNELAPSMQEVIKALQKEINIFNEKDLTTNIIRKLLHFDTIFRTHINSDYPHPNSLNCLLRQPNTFYKLGDIVFDTEAPPYCYLECIDSGYTGDNSSIYNTNRDNEYISDEDYDFYSNVANVNEALNDLYNLLQQHLNLQDTHPKALNFLIRQPKTQYNIGDIVFDAEAPSYCFLECIEAGTTAAASTTTYNTTTNPTTLKDLDSTLQSMTNSLEEHISSETPHNKYTFLVRDKTKNYTVGNTIFYNARYILECSQNGKPGSTLNKAMIDEAISMYQYQYNQDILDARQESTSTEEIAKPSYQDNIVIYITVLDLKNSEAILIQTDYQTVLIDTGLANSDVLDEEYQAAVNSGRASEVYRLQQKLLIQALERYNISRIDKLIITHPHSDHIGNAYMLIDSSIDDAISNYPYLKHVYVTKVYDNGVISNNSEYTKYQTAIHNKGIEHEILKAGDSLDLGNDVILDILWPTPTYRDSVNSLIINGVDESPTSSVGHQINNSSLVGRLRYKDFSMLLTGDIEAEAENQILDLYRDSNIQCSILKLPNHGLWTSTTDNFLSTIMPDKVVISDGVLLDDNKYQELKPGQLKNIVKCTKFGIESSNIFFTRFNNDIVINVTELGNNKVVVSNKENWLSVIPHPIKIHMLDIGAGDALVVQTPEQNILIDTGQPYFDSMKKLLDGLERCHIHKIDKLIITHFHADHYGGAALLLDGNTNHVRLSDEEIAAGKEDILNRYASTITVDEIYDNDVPCPQVYRDLDDGISTVKESAWKSLYNAALGKRPHTALKAGDVLEFGEGCTFEVIWPTEEYVNFVKLKPADLLKPEKASIIDAYRAKHPVDPISKYTSKNALNELLQAVKGQSSTYNFYIPSEASDDIIATLSTVSYNNGVIKYTIWDPYNVNNSSIVGILRYKGFSMLFTGDCETESQLRIMHYLPDNSILHTDVLKAGHHGAASGSWKDFVNIVSPSCVLVSKNLSFDENGDIINNAPATTAIDRWTSTGVSTSNIYYTGYNGHVTITVNDWDYNVNCQTEIDWVDIYKKKRKEQSQK